MNNLKKTAENLIKRIKKEQLQAFQEKMPITKKGVEFTMNGKTYIAAIRRLTPTECKRLQTVPEDYEFVTSETRQYQNLGNGWCIEVIKHIFSFIPENKRKHLKVLSLFDGMSGGQIALNGIGCKPDLYLASEIDKYAIENTQHNFPDTIQIGDVKNINVEELIKKYGIPDIIIAGSPCTDMSYSGKMRGMITSTKEEVYTLERYLELKRQGFIFEGQSYLFWEFMRILTELRKFNPNIYFFLENVRMLKKWERCLSHAIGVRGVHINAALVSAQNRRRIYWSNIKIKEVTPESLFYDAANPFAWPNIITDIPQPKDKGLTVKDILQDDVDEKYYLKSETVEKLIKNTDKSKLKEYLLEPQIDVKEILAYMYTQREFDALTDKEKHKIAQLTYQTEVRNLKESFYEDKKSV